MLLQVKRRADKMEESWVRSQKTREEAIEKSEQNIVSFKQKRLKTAKGVCKRSRNLQTFSMLLCSCHHQPQTEKAASCRENTALSYVVLLERHPICFWKIVARCNTPPYLGQSSVFSVQSPRHATVKLGSEENPVAM